MGSCGTKVTADEGCIAGLDDNTASPGGNEASGGAHARTHAALWHGRGDVAFSPDGAGTVLAGLPEHNRGVPRGAGPTRVANASELAIEVVLGHATPPERAVMLQRNGAADGLFKTASNSPLIRRGLIRRWRQRRGTAVNDRGSDRPFAAPMTS